MMSVWMTLCALRREAGNMYLVGIDVGTTNTKTVIFDVETGQINAVGSCRSITRHPVPEWSEFDAEDVWGAVLQSMQAAIARCDRPDRICQPQRTLE